MSGEPGRVSSHKPESHQGCLGEIVVAIEQHQLVRPGILRLLDE